MRLFGFDCPFFSALPDETEFAAESPCFGRETFDSLIDSYGVGNGCSARVAVSEFKIILRTKADCITKHADEDLAVAQLTWTFDELIQALEMRENLLLV